MTEWEELKESFIDLWDEIRMSFAVSLLELAQKIAPDNDDGKRLNKMLYKWSADEVRIYREKNNAR